MSHTATPKIKTVNDPIHGHIDLPQFVVDVIDTAQFQRLRDLKQLGVTYYVFPGSSHSRFEHSIGVSHLADELMTRLKEEQPSLEIKDHDVKLVQLAGLCHDLGHGPFSHAFEGWVKRVGKVNFHHEDMSKKMVQHLVDENNIDLDPSDISYIQALIEGKSKSQHEERKWMFQIVSNSLNSIDVDKFDYLARDCYNIGMKSSYDPSRLMRFSRVIDDEICYHAKEVFNIYSLFHTRYNLFKQIYSHRVGKAIEYMVSDILLLADDYLKISARLDSPETYTYLTDSILLQIEGSTQPELAKSRELLMRLRKRKLYKMADEIVLPSSHSLVPEIGKLDVSKLLSYAPSDSQLTEDDIIIDDFKCNYALRDQNPVDNVHFFKKSDVNTSFKIPKDNVSLLIPDQFSEQYYRIYCRNPEKTEPAKIAFRNYLKERNFE